MFTMKRTKVLLTGATGNMGREGLKLLHAQKDRFDIIVFALPTPQDKKFLSGFVKEANVSIVWGDLTNYEDVKRAVAQADIVLHVGALVSPLADHQPELAWKVNFEGTKNIVDAVLDRNDHDQVKLIYIGTIAETGNRVPPYHWGRIGDPLLPSVFDHYALSKIAAERYVIKSGLKYWVSLRQTGIMHENILDVNDGIGYHQPINNHLEWVTAHDSGRILLNVCDENLTESFWRNVYNIGGGEACRLTAFQFTQKVYKILGIDFRKLEHPNWYALRNFHGHWYYDSDKLQEFLQFRTESVDDVLEHIRKKLPFRLRILKYLPKGLIRNGMRRQALKGDTPLNWEKHNNKPKIKAFFGSKEIKESIPNWHEFEIVVNPTHKKLDHGYDESIPDEELTIKDIQKVAAFRGGKCLSTTMPSGDLHSKLKWSCAHGHEFEASPFLILKTGHWCEQCLQPPWNFDEQARHNPFMAQVWLADHGEGEDCYY